METKVQLEYRGVCGRNPARPREGVTGLDRQARHPSRMLISKVLCVGDVSPTRLLL